MKLGITCSVFMIPITETHSYDTLDHIVLLAYRKTESYLPVSWL